MSCKFWTLLATVLVVAGAGCGGSRETPPASDDNIETSANQDQDTPTEEYQPAAAVSEFLNAFRAGDDERTARMLTPKARAGWAALNLPLSATTDDSDKFELGRVAYLPEDRAAVACLWTDLDDTVQMKNIEYVWMLRREAKSWLIAGVAIPVFENQPPLQLDFEDLDQMQANLRWVRDERLRQAKPADSRARPAENSENSVRR